MYAHQYYTATEMFIMYTVNNTNFFDFGVDAGDFHLEAEDASFGFLPLFTPIQFVTRPQHTLYVSQLYVYLHLYARPIHDMLYA